MKKADLKDKDVVKLAEKDMKVALKMQRKDNPDLVLLMDPAALTPKPVWEKPEKLTAKADDKKVKTP